MKQTMHWKEGGFVPSAAEKAVVEGGLIQQFSKPGKYVIKPLVGDVKGHASFLARENPRLYRADRSTLFMIIGAYEERSAYFIAPPQISEVEFSKSIYPKATAMTSGDNVFRPINRRLMLRVEESVPGDGVQKAVQVVDKLFNQERPACNLLMGMIAREAGLSSGFEAIPLEILTSCIESAWKELQPQQPCSGLIRDMVINVLSTGRVLIGVAPEDPNSFCFLESGWLHAELYRLEREEAETKKRAAELTAAERQVASDRESVKKLHGELAKANEKLANSRKKLAALQENSSKPAH